MDELKPLMDDEGLRYFSDSICMSNCFLEYGAGGSTFHAAHTVKLRVRVDDTAPTVQGHNHKGRLSLCAYVSCRVLRLGAIDLSAQRVQP